MTALSDLAGRIEAASGNLTPAQRRAVLALSETPAPAKRDRYSANAAFNLIRVGITKLSFDRTALRDNYHLTPFGLEVRRALDAQQSKGRGE